MIIYTDLYKRLLDAGLTVEKHFLYENIGDNTIYCVVRGRFYTLSFLKKEDSGFAEDLYITSNLKVSSNICFFKELHSSVQPSSIDSALDYLVEVSNNV